MTVHHQLDVYGAWLHVTRSKKQWRAWRKELHLELPRKIESLGLTTRATDPRDGLMHFCVFIDKRLSDTGLVEIVAHEATHMAGLLLDAIDTSYDGLSEPHAYLVGWATAFIWEHVTGNAGTAT